MHLRRETEACLPPEATVRLTSRRLTTRSIEEDGVTKNRRSVCRWPHRAVLSVRRDRPEGYEKTRTKTTTHRAELPHHPHRAQAQEAAYRASPRAAHGHALRAAVAPPAAAAALTARPRRERRGAAGERARARRRASGFRRQGRDHQCAARSRGHALRARARARHQVLARDRACRRHRPLHERDRRARRRGAGP